MKSGPSFTGFANTASRTTGRSYTFVFAVGIIAVWAITGPLFKFSDTWQLVINTGTTIITFLMVFLIQNTQNRDSEAVQIKLDEIIRALEGAHNALLDLEELDDEKLDEMRLRYRNLAKKARDDIKAGGRDIGCEEIEAETNDADKAVPAKD